MPLYKKFSDHKDNHLVIWEIKEGKQELVSALKTDSFIVQALVMLSTLLKLNNFNSCLEINLGQMFKILSLNFSISIPIFFFE